MTDNYRQVGSFESRRVEAVGVGHDVIAIGLEDRLELVTGSDSTGIDHGDRILDVAVADRVIVLSPGELTTYSRTGDRLWTQSVEDAHAIAAITNADICGVLGPDRVSGIDVSSGRERFDVERSRPGGPDDALIAVPTGFLIATWTFLTHVDVEGHVDFDRDLSAVVRSVGRCDDTLVAALQSDQLVGLQAGTGDPRWRTELEANHVAPVGEGTVLVSTTDGTRSVSSDGTTEPVGDLPGGETYTTPSGTLVCAVRGGTVATYVHTREQLGLEVATETVGIGGTIDIHVSNPTDRERTATLTVDVTGCSLSPAERTVSVAPGVTELVDFPVSAVRAEGVADLSIAVDGSVASETSITVEDAASGGLAVDAALETASIDDGVAKLAVTVENVGGVALDSVSLLETETGTDELQPGETWTGSVTRPYEPDRRVSVGLEVFRGDRRREYAPTCTLPALPTIDVESGRDAIRATIVTDGDPPVSDRLVIEVPGAGRVRSPVTIDGDELLVVVPLYEDGTARIALDAIDVDERVQVSDLSLFTTSSGTRSTRERRGNRSSSRSRSDPPSRQPGSDSRSDPGSDPGAADTFAASDPTDSRGPKRHLSGPPDQSQSTTATDADSQSLSVTRRVDDSLVLGHAVRDRIVVSAVDGRAEEVSVIIDDERVELGSVPAGETATVERAVGAVSIDGVVLAPATVEAGGTIVDRLPERRLEVSSEGLAVRAAVDPTDGTVVADLANRDDRNCRVLGVEIDGPSRPESIDERLEAGATATVTASLDTVGGDGRGLGVERDAVGLSIAVRYDDGKEETIDALAAVTPLEGGGTATGSSSPENMLLTAAIGPETQAAGEYGSVVLVFKNESNRPLLDVSVSATGDPINDMFYSEARRGELAAGDWIEHFVDLESGIDEPTFEATVSYMLEDSSERAYTVRASGPAVTNEAEWTDDHLAAWSVERLDEATAGNETLSVPELPSSLSTSLRRR
ncbi:hypothetical protein G6M89_08040 [Natronolimnobius sp. AArcel1]|uniref:outer membrane protein assembly factor BamB family protein n=1 Tax=Natronolimnobius sp. AArcel1 TaxID=1679093 RepID=UPI0013EC3C3F|nr:PQQ-binding-like beta-propeller repeat protein [Natronolimnobius sp. AArcel1]NGM68962.1 hypothetical protein [Natronolimnobius sp. AArcel1]